MTWPKSVASLLTVVLVTTAAAPARAAKPEDDAQQFYVQAMSAYDTGQFDEALRLLDRSAREAQKLADKSWRASVQKTVLEAKVGILYEAGIARWESESYQAAFNYFQSCAGLMAKNDKRLATVRKNIAKSAYMLTLQLWLNHQYQKARDTAREAEKAAKVAYKEGGTLKTKLDDIYLKITHKHTDELVAAGEIKRAYSELKKDYAILPDPSFAYKLGDLGTELRAFGEAERYYARARDSAKKMAAAGSSRAGELQSIITGSQEKIVHIRSLRKQMVVRSNVPHYQVEIYRPYTDDPIEAKEAEDSKAGVTFELYPGTYRVKVINADYGVCTRDEVPLKKESVDITCEFEKPATVVSIDTVPSGVKVKIVPSTMVAARSTPFQTELYRGGYTLQAWMEGFDQPVEVPFVVENETNQEFHFNLDYAELDISVPDGATVRIDGKFHKPGVEPARVGVGSHLIEVTKVGHVPISQRMFVRPREIKTLFYELQKVEETPPEFVYTAPLIDVRAGYGGDFVGYDLVTKDAAGGKDKVQSTSFPLHHVLAMFDIYLTSNKDAAIKPYIRVGADIAFALGSPIDSLLDIDAVAGFGLLMDRWDRARLDANLSYHFMYGFWSDSLVKRPFDMGIIYPVGIGLQTAGHYDAFQAELSLGFATGGGQRNYSDAAGGGSDISTTWFELMVFAGADFVDMFDYNPDLDVAVGLVGGMMWYGEDQTPDKGDATNFSTIDGRVGAGLRVRYVTKTNPRTAFLLDLDALFLGGLIPEFPGIIENKIEVSPRLGNIDLRAGIELRF
ncbi:MAG: hypothetical protein AMXMBFR64_48810 [Myxococcales bacterium]